MTMLIEPTRTRAAVTKAVIPAGGPGTRFLPATTEIPREMLPVVDKPAVQYVVEEAVAAGCDDLLLVTAPGMRSIEDHFDLVPPRDLVAEVPADLGHEPVRAPHVHYVRQGQPLGLGHAVLQAERHVGGEAFALLLGDDLVDVRDPILPRMLDVRARYGGSVVALMEVPADEITGHGCAAARAWLEQDVIELADLVEKPAVDEAPSNLAIIGRYVLDPEVFPILRRTPPGRGGMVQLTDALRTLSALPAEHGGGVRGVIFAGRRYDTGDPLSYLKAVVQLASCRDDLGSDFRAWLREFTDGLGE